MLPSIGGLIDIDSDENPHPGIANRAAISLGIFLASVTACEVGLQVLGVGFWSIVPIWPPVGVALAAFHLFGNRSWIPLILGHSWILLRLDPSAHILLWSVPLLFTFEAWFANCLGVRMFQKTSRSPLTRQLAQQFLAPTIAALPFSALVATFAYLSWYSNDVIPSLQAATHPWLLIWVLIFLAHMLAMTVLTPMLLCILRKEHRSLWDVKRPGQLVAVTLAIIGLTFLALGFGGKLSPPLSSQAASILPLPFLLISAIWMNNMQIKFLALITTTIAIGMHAIGPAPFSQGPGITNGHAELGAYLLFIIIAINTLSWVNSEYHRKLEHLNLIMNCVGMHAWQWNHGNGLTVEHNGCGAVKNSTHPHPIERAIRFPDKPAREIDDTWTEKYHEELSTGDMRHWENFGHVFQRLPDGRPAIMLGIIRDVSGEKIAHETQLKLDQQKAIMQGLQARLNPHFLFNTLNMIKALVRIDAGKAESAVLNLSNMLRMSLKSTEFTFIPLAKEIDNIHSLFEVAGMRFENKISRTLNIPPELASWEIPVMLLFNQVENAITHGISRITGPGHIRIEATQAGEDLILRIQNTGTLDAFHKNGVGHSDARKRLQLIYGTRASLSIAQTQPDEVTCTITIPPPPSDP